MLTFSIIIISRQINDYIRQAMPHILSQTYQNFEVIIVSENDEKEKFPKTRIINSGRASPSQARNIGVKNAKGDILAFIDDDAYPEKDWLENAVKNFEDKSIVAVGGPGLVPREGTFFQKVSSKVYELTSGKTGIRYGIGKRREIDDWPTCNFFARRKEFDKTGGFDEKYWGGEDTQISYELLYYGKIIYDPEVIIYHHPRKNLKQHLKQTYFWGMWRGFFMRMHKKSRQLTFFVPSLFLMWIFFGTIFSLFSKYVMYLYGVSLGFYLLYLLYLGVKSKSLKLFFPVMGVTFLTHISYGLGFIKGILNSNEPIKKTLNPAEAKK